MSKTYKIASILFLLLVLALTWLESSEPEPLNWTPSYTSTDKLPLGTRVFFESWKQRNPKLHLLKIPPYEYLNDTVSQGTYFFLNDRLSFDDNELEDLLTWVAQGNTLFMSAYEFGENPQRFQE